MALFFRKPDLQRFRKNTWRMLADTTKPDVEDDKVPVGGGVPVAKGHTQEVWNVDPGAVPQNAILAFRRAEGIEGFIS